MKGHVKIELFDHKTGKIKTTEHENMLTNALSEIMENYVSKSYLDYVLDERDYLTLDNLSGYVSQSDVSSYLSEGLAGLGNLLSAADLEGGGYVSSSNFAAALGAYLEEYGGETIYDAISQYIHQEG